MVRLMREHGVRRIPLTEEGQPVGLVTFDDLVLDGSIDLDALRGIVTAQLEVEARQKPAGMLHPTASATAEGRARALMRAKVRAEATYDRMINAVPRVRPDWIATAPSARCFLYLHALPPSHAGGSAAPHRSTSLAAPAAAGRLPGGTGPVSNRPGHDRRAHSVARSGSRPCERIRAVFKVISASVSAGQIAEVRGQLPQEMKALFPTAA